MWVPLLNFERVPGVPLLNFELEGGGGEFPWAPLLNLRVILCLTFKLWEGPVSRAVVPVLHHADL